MLLGSGLSSGSSVITLGLQVVLRDNFTAQSQKINASMAALNANTNKFVAAGTAARNAYGAAAVVGGAALMTFGKWYQEGIKFDHVMRGVKVVTEATGQELEGLSQRAKDMSIASIFKPEDIAKSMQIIGQAGFNAKEVNSTIKAVNDMAMGTLSDTKTSAEFLVATLNTFQIPKDNVQEITRTVNLLGTAANKSSTDLYNMFETFRYSSTTARYLGLNVKQLSGLAMAVSNAGLRGSMGGTALENMMRYVSRAVGEFQTKRQKKSFGMAGIKREDLMDPNTGALRPWEDIFETLGHRLAGLGQIKQQSIMENIFGVRGQRAAGIMIKNLQDFKKMQNELNNPQDMSKLSAYINDGPWASIERLKNSWNVFKIQFASSIKPLATALVGFLTYFLKAVTWLMKIPFLGKGLAILGVGFVIVKTATYLWRTAIIAAALAQSTMVSSGIARTAALGSSYTILTNKANLYTASLLRQRAASLGGARGTALAQGMLGMGYAVNSAGAIYGPKGRMVSNKNLGSLIGKGAGAGLMLQGARLGANTMGRAAVGFGAKALGVLTGPWGIALMVGATVLPMIWDAVKGTNAAIDKNTEAVQTNGDKAAEMANMLTLIADRLQEKQYKESGQFGGMSLSNMLDFKQKEDRYKEYAANTANHPGKFYDTSKPGMITVYLDGNAMGRGLFTEINNISQDYINKAFSQITK